MRIIREMRIMRAVLIALCFFFFPSFLGLGLELASEELVADTAGNTTTGKPTANNARRNAATWKVYVYTVSPSDLGIYSLWGHTALRIQNQQERIDWMIDFGNFSLDKHLVYGIITGRAQFFMGIGSSEEFVLRYSLQDRAIFRQRIFLNDSRSQRLFEILQSMNISQDRFYRYDHFADNCTTRIRDMINQELNGVLNESWTKQSLSFSLRDAAMEFLRVQPLPWFYGQMLMYPRIYAPTNIWESAFLPTVFMQELERLRVASPYLPLGKIENVYLGSQQGLSTALWQWLLLFAAYLGIFVSLILGGRSLNGVAQKSRLGYRLGYSQVNILYFVWLAINIIVSIIVTMFLIGHHGGDVSQSNFFWMIYSPITLLILLWHIFAIRRLWYNPKPPAQVHSRHVSAATATSTAISISTSGATAARIRHCAWMHFAAGLLAALSMLLDIPIHQKVYIHALPELALHASAFFAMLQSSKYISKG